MITVLLKEGLSSLRSGQLPKEDNCLCCMQIIQETLIICTLVQTVISAYMLTRTTQHVANSHKYSG